MSGFDMVARGIARRAGAAQPTLFTSYRFRPVPDTIDRLETSGRSSVGRGAGTYLADALADEALYNTHPRFVLRTSNGRYFRLAPNVDGMIHVDQAGAVADGMTPNDYAFSAALAYCEAIGAQGLRLGQGTYALANGGGLNWSRSDLRLTGEGIGRTVLRQIDHARTDGAALTLGTCSRIAFSDLTLHGANAFGTLYCNNAVVEDARFERVRFTSDAQSDIDATWFSSTNGVRWVAEGTARARRITFIDCEFVGCGRMGIEFQNHVGDTIARYSDIDIVRPRFVDIGGANESAGYTAGMGISLSGYGDAISVQQPFFDNVRQVCLEIVGASRVKLSDIRVRHDTVGAGLIQATNFRPMHGNVIDGLRWIAADGATILTDPPAVPVNIRLDNWVGGVVRDVQLSTSGDRALRLGVNYPSTGNVVEGCHLTSDGSYVVENFQSARNVFRGNRLTSTAAGTAGAVAVFGDNSVDCVIDANMLAAPNASSWTPLLLTGAATARYTDSNTGKRLQASGQMVMASGTKYVAVDHGLGTVPTAFGVTPKGNLGSTNAPPWSGVAANVINAQTSANVSSPVTFAWWARVDYGNI